MLQELVEPENREWVSQLTVNKLAAILDMLGLVKQATQLRPPADVYPTIDDIMTQVDTRIANHVAANAANSQVPAHIGRRGEMKFSDIVHHLPKSYSTIDTAKRARSGDFIIEWTDDRTQMKYRIMVDVKNYNKTVPSNEVDKFHRDLSLMTNTHGAILLSLKSKIVGKPQWYMETATSQPKLYIASCDPNIICESIQAMFGIISSYGKCGSTLQINETVMGHIRGIDKTAESLATAKHSLQVARNTMATALDNTIADINRLDTEIKLRIETALQSIIAHTQAKPPAAETQPCRRG